MKKELYIAIITSIILLFVFIISVIITEKTNTDSIRSTHTIKIKTADSGSVLIPYPTEKAIQFQKNKVAVWIARLLLSFLIPALFLFSRLSAGLRTWAQGRSRNFILVVALYFIIYSIIDYMLKFPLDFYSGFIRMHNYGLSNQTFIKWLSDSLKSFILSTGFTAVFLWVPYIAIRKCPNTWWIYMGLLSIPVLIFITYISPVFIDPMFNKYVPVQNKSLEAKIQEQLGRTVIGDCQIYQVNKSVDTNQMNAYMTGVFNTRRIVLWDTTINRLTEREVSCVTAHEMGHYLMGHVWKSIVLGGGLTIILLFFVNKTALWIIAKSGGIFGFNKLYDIATLPLLILLINLLIFATAPVENAYSRHIETEADRFELELTHDNLAAATAMVKLHWESLSLPEPGLIYKLWNYDHPTFKDRVNFANNYKPWDKNESQEYQRFIVK